MTDKLTEVRNLLDRWEEDVEKLRMNGHHLQATMMDRSRRELKKVFEDE